MKLISLWLIALGTLILVLTVAVQAQDTIPAIDPVTVNDGPYVIWSDDSTLTVSCVCAGEHQTTDLSISDSVLLKDCCGLGELPDIVAYRSQSQPDQHDFENVSRFFALSDIHGEYGAMVEILIAVGVIDSSLNWSFTDGHLVINGDVFDRGSAVTECLWLIYKLEHQASEAGGWVSFLLGNHELMPLRGDERYYNEKYIATSNVIGHTQTELYGPKSLLGQWLRTKNCIILIDSTLFVHGGISPEIVQSGLTMPKLNALARQWIDKPREEIKADSTANLINGSMGPFWYRGLTWTYGGYSRQSSDELTRLLTHFGAKSVVVGHSEQDSLMGYYSNQLFAIDVPVSELGGLQGLLFENDRFYRVGHDGTRTPIIANPESIPRDLEDSE